MYGGELTLCLKCEDLNRAQRFYELLGMEADKRSDSFVLMKSGNTRIALMTFLTENCLNFRGADPFVVHRAYREDGFQVDGEPEVYRAEKYSADADGSCWSTYDPDGNNVFLDTNDNETSEDGKRKRIHDLLLDTAADLANLGASAECQQAIKELANAELGSD